MKDLTYQDAYFLIILNKFKKSDKIDKQEVIETLQQIKEKYRVWCDFVDSNTLEELLIDHKDILIEEDKYISLRKENSIGYINNKYLRHITEDVRNDINNICSDNKILKKTM